MKILLATSNPHKIEEIQAVFEAEPKRAGSCGVAPVEVEFIGLGDLGASLPEPVEDQDTFDGNAILKARHYASLSGLVCLADDSGLEVDALGGEPGVRSARFAGVDGPRDVADRANNALLLTRLGETPAAGRQARFVCAMALCAPAPGGTAAGGTEGPVLALMRGTVEGRILGPGDPGYDLNNPGGRGSNGFGYDPLFLLPDQSKTTAELSPPQKNRISHRGQAARKMWKWIGREATNGEA